MYLLLVWGKYTKTFLIILYNFIFLLKFFKLHLQINIKDMSKRCELQKEYYKEFGNYKGVGKYSDHYVRWLETKILFLINEYEINEKPKCTYPKIKGFNLLKKEDYGKV